MTHPADVIDIARQAAILVGRAEALGVTLRITGQPRQPLAMGNHMHVIDAWPARHGAPVWKEVGRLSGASQLPHEVASRWVGSTPLSQRTRSG